MTIALALLVLAGLAWVFLFSPAPRGSTDTRALPSPPSKLDQLPGGSPSRALVVESPAVIESRAGQDPCLACGARIHCDHHRVEIHADRRVRVADLKCPRCGFERVMYFVLQT